MCAGIVPVYHMGSSQMLRCTGSSEWSRKMRASMCIFWGRYGLPLPYRHDIISLVAPPLHGELLCSALVKGCRLWASMTLAWYIWGFSVSSYTSAL